MRNTKQPDHLQKGARTIDHNKANRIRAAARLSQDTPPAEICQLLGISPRTLRRYADDPRWKENGGVDLPTPLYLKLNLKKKGRPQNDQEKEKKLLTEAHRLHDDGMKWKAIADQLGISIRQLEYLRSKYPS